MDLAFRNIYSIQIHDLLTIFQLGKINVQKYCSGIKIVKKKIALKTDPTQVSLNRNYIWDLLLHLGTKQRSIQYTYNLDQQSKFSLKILIMMEN